MRRTGWVFVLFLVTVLAVIGPPARGVEDGGAAKAEPPDRWTEVSFLVGDWVGEGSPDSGRGEFSFRFELGGKVLIRRSFAEYPAMAGHAAFRHDDLLVVYEQPGQLELAAIYFDSEGHVIHYRLVTPASVGGVVFLSEPAQGSPQYRLAYDRLSDDAVEVRFEIAPPGEPARFKPYLAARCHRKRPA